MPPPATNPPLTLDQLVHARALLAKGVVNYGEKYLPLFDMFDQAIKAREALHISLKAAILEDEKTR